MAIPAQEAERIFVAVEAGDGETVRAMIRTRPDIVDAQRASDNLSLVLYAMYLGKWEIVDLIAPIHPGLDIFESAALGRQQRVAHLTRTNPRLLRANSPDGFTALHLAAFFGQINTARLLIERGADVNAVTANRLANRPLHAAAASQQFAVCELLLANGADVNAQQHGGFTALHAAAQHGDRSLAELLICRGADRRILTDDGKTAADLAMTEGHGELATFLREPP